MADADFHLTLEFPVPAAQLYAQFASAAGVAHWWTVDCRIDARVGGRAEFHFADDGFDPVMRVTALGDPLVVEWEVVSARHPDSFGYKNPHDWEGTRLRFEVEAAGKGASRLKFTHTGLMAVESGTFCSEAWRHFLGVSLREFFEKGKGRPTQRVPAK